MLPSASEQVAVLATWLEAPTAERVRAQTERWSAGAWRQMLRLIAAQGLAPHLARTLPPARIALPDNLCAWLDEQAALNAARLKRMHAELAAILAAATDAGIAVMPLKGALLTTRLGMVSRPMADLDLLVRPAERMALRRLLERLGYRHEPEANPRPTHDVYVDAGLGRVVSHAAEHPDNPRRVEVHTEVLRHLWAWIDDDELTPALWSRALRADVVGQQAVVPHIEDLQVHLAVHATADLLIGRGRLVQWLDLATIASAAQATVGLHPLLAVPSLMLAARAMPSRAGPLRAAVEGLSVPRSLRDWANAVPLDGRCGLQTDVLLIRPSSLRARWKRWAPYRWRLLVAFGDQPLPVALARYGLLLAQRWRGRFASVREA